jgi:hypothetical protein
MTPAPQLGPLAPFDQAREAIAAAFGPLVDSLSRAAGGDLQPVRAVHARLERAEREHYGAACRRNVRRIARRLNGR